jgi:hypothetical protein
MCDRSLATAILFDQCPRQQVGQAVRALVAPPANMGVSYPANAAWRFWALARAGHTEPIVDEWRRRWAGMGSVVENNTVQEDWEAKPDSGAQWSHCAVAPLYALYMCLAGIAPTAPGFEHYEIRPQPADLEGIELTAHTAAGAIEFESHGTKGARRLRLRLPPRGQGTLVLDAREAITLPAVENHRGRLKRYALPAGGGVDLDLRHT